MSNVSNIVRELAESRIKVQATKKQAEAQAAQEALDKGVEDLRGLLMGFEEVAVELVESGTVKACGYIPGEYVPQFRIQVGHGMFIIVSHGPRNGNQRPTFNYLPQVDYGIPASWSYVDNPEQLVPLLIDTLAELGVKSGLAPLEDPHPNCDLFARGRYIRRRHQG